jgi:pyruvate dehydrogenase E2 component (dihydrolipoamide acetyltransferase)
MSDSQSDPLSQTARTPRVLTRSRMQIAVGRQMAASKQKVPHFYVSTDIVMDSVIDEAHRLTDHPGSPRVSATACLIRELAQTLAEHSEFNALWTPDGYVIGDRVHIGVAIALETGLLAPALFDCQRLDLTQTAAALEDLVARARSGRLRASELGTATFTLSNLGMYEVTGFAAIVIPPQVAILATGRAMRRPVVVGNQIVVRSVMTATLSADHRAVDGAQAARFLMSLKARLESFGSESARPDGLSRPT